MSKFDITLITASKFLKAKDSNDWYVNNLLEDDRLLAEALKKHGLKVTRTNWDNPEFNWSKTKYAIFRTPWDYFNRYAEFSQWLKKTSKQTLFINSIDIIKWNIDKHYMLELEKAGIRIPQTIFVEPGDTRSLAEITEHLKWNEFILKPAISGGAWHTYRLNSGSITEHESIYGELIKDKSMLIQEYQNSITGKGEVSYMLFGGKFTHAVLKKAKADDYRVQDDYGGTVHDYSPTQDEIEFAEMVVKYSKPGIPYARVDVMWDNSNKLVVGELELFEPELWFRRNPPGADLFAEIILDTCNR